MDTTRIVSKSAVYAVDSQGTRTLAEASFKSIAPEHGFGVERGDRVTRVLIVDDHQLLRQGYIALLARSGDFLVVGEATDGVEAIEMALSNNPDVVLMDIQMPRMNGLKAIEEIHRRLDGTLILVISMMNEAAIIRQCLAKGARGFISKDDSFDELATAIHSIREGKVYLGRRAQVALAVE